MKKFGNIKVKRWIKIGTVLFVSTIQIQLGKGNVFAKENNWGNFYEPLGIEQFFELQKGSGISIKNIEFFDEALCKLHQEEYNRKRNKEKKETQKERDQIIFVGDSRVVGMSMAGGYYYVGKESIGYDWFANEGVYQMLDLMYQHPDASVVLCFGINDVGNVGAYISYYQSLMNQYPDTDFWVMSVNPVNDGMASSCGYYINSDMVNTFNSIMMEAFPDRYLDCYTYLEQSGFGTGDGVHYDIGTYLVVQEYTKFLINNL